MSSAGPRGGARSDIAEGKRGRRTALPLLLDRLRSRAATRVQGSVRAVMPAALVVGVAVGLAAAPGTARAQADSTRTGAARAARGTSRFASALDSLDEEALPSPLPQLSGGDVLFVADAAAFPGPDSSFSRVEFYLRVANEQLVFSGPDSTGSRQALVQVDLSLATPDGHPFRRWTRQSRLTAADSEAATSLQVRQVLEWSYNVEPGDYIADFTVTDLSAPKKTLLGRIHKSFRAGKARGMIRVRPFSADSLELSDLEFAESFIAGDTSAFRKQRLTVYPNPGRRYGRPDSDVKVYLEGHLPRGQAAGEMRLVWEVLDVKGRRLLLLADSLHAEPSFDRAQVLRLQALQAGRYRLRLTAVPSAGPARKVEGTFDMAWAPGAALDRSVVALVDEARLLFENEELDRFLEMSPGEQERYWNEYWTRQTLSPETADLDPRAEFESRIAYANQTYGGNERGMFTDRGRIFVKYGAPDEITQRMLPVGGESLSDIGDLLPLETDSDKGELLRQPGAQGRGDTRSYEIWDYDLHGRNLYGTRARQGRHGGRMRFIFVDENGVGNYLLKYSSE